MESSTGNPENHEETTDFEGAPRFKTHPKMTPPKKKKSDRNPGVQLVVHLQPSRMLVAGHDLGF